MDAVYIVRPGNRNDELRYSLRSLHANFRVDRVWIVGFRPNWVTGVEYVPVDQVDHKHQNTWMNWSAIARHPDISDPFVFMNDDFFILRPLDRMPLLHQGTVADWPATHGGTPWSRRLERTRELLAAVGHTDPLSYELHVPMVMARDAHREAVQVLAAQRRPWDYAKRTLVGNLAGGGGERARDVKIADDAQWERRGGAAEVGTWSFVSTADASFKYGTVGRWLRARFPEPSPYERR